MSAVQVDRLIEAGREILRNYPAFQRLVADLRGGQAASAIVSFVTLTRTCRGDIKPTTYRAHFFASMEYLIGRFQ
jgi:hypothetical protein